MILSLTTIKLEPISSDNQMVKIFNDIEKERDRAQACINKYGWTSDHNLDWFLDGDMSHDQGDHCFVEFSDGSGLFAIRYSNEWRIWSDPLTPKEKAAERIIEFSKNVLGGEIKEVWCDYVTDYIRPNLVKIGSLKINDVYFSLLYLVLDMLKYDPNLPGRYFKEIRNAKNKFYREHEVKILDVKDTGKEEIYRIIDQWKINAVKKQRAEDVYDSWYKNAAKNRFRGFKSVRVIVVDGRPVGINGGYEVVNHPGRFAGIIGIHDYSHRDLGTILWLEDLEWIKNHGYKEVDMQGWEENDGALKFEMRLGGKVDRKTDTFSIKFL